MGLQLLVQILCRKHIILPHGESNKKDFNFIWEKGGGIYCAFCIFWIVVYYFSIFELTLETRNSRIFMDS